jgi:hypothetical protein
MPGRPPNQLPPIPLVCAYTQINSPREAQVTAEVHFPGAYWIFVNGTFIQTPAPAAASQAQTFMEFEHFDMEDMRRGRAQSYKTRSLPIHFNAGKNSISAVFMPAVGMPQWLNVMRVGFTDSEGTPLGCEGNTLSMKDGN